MIGTAKLNDYILESPLGQGGMATVHRAVHRPTGQVVALKRMLPHIAADEVFVARFVRELEVSAKLRNPHIVEVQGWGKDEDGTWFLALEYCDGGTLVQLLKQVPKLPPAIVAVMLDELLDALQTAHDDGVIHRDIKPPNILLTMTGASKLSDFGIARSASDQTLTATGEVIGTPAYMSPEQAIGVRDLDGRSDLFAVGMLAYRLLVGFNPFASENVATSILRVTTGPSLHVGEALPTVPLALERTIDGLIEKNRDQRLPSAQAARDRLAPVVDAVRARFPDLLQRLMNDPQKTVHAVARAAAAEEIAAARICERTLPAKAMVHATRARAHDPDDLDAASMIDKLSTLHGFRLDNVHDARIVAAETELETRPEDPVVIRRLANLHRGLNNPLEAVRYLKRYLLLRPDDVMARNQLGELLGADDVVALTRSVAVNRLSTQEIMQGVRTGGVKAQRPASTSSSFTSSSTVALTTSATLLAPSLDQAPSTRYRAGIGGPAVLDNDGPSEALLSGRLKVVLGIGAVLGVIALGSVVTTAMRKGEAGLDKTLRAVETTQTTMLDGMIDGTQQPFIERAESAARLADWQGVIDAVNFGIAADPDRKGRLTPTLLLLRSKARAGLGEPRPALADARLAAGLAAKGSPVAVEAAGRVAELTATVGEPPAAAPPTSP